MGWPLRQFWESTPAELYHCYRGYLRSKGIDPDAEPPSIERGEAISDQIDEALEARLARGA